MISCGCAGAASPGTALRLLCQLKPLDFISSGEHQGLAGPGKGEGLAQAGSQKKARVKVAKRRRVVHPPAELLILPSNTTLKGLQEAVQAAFSSVYQMFAEMKARLTYNTEQHTVFGNADSALQAPARDSS